MSCPALHFDFERWTPDAHINFFHGTKTITINVSEPVYRDFMDHARKVERPTSELIPQARWRTITRAN